jgi:hypothetical protein
VNIRHIWPKVAALVSSRKPKEIPHDVYLPSAVVVAKLGTGVALAFVVDEDRQVYCALPRSSAVTLVDTILDVLDQPPRETVQ